VEISNVTKKKKVEISNITNEKNKELKKQRTKGKLTERKK